MLQALVSPHGYVSQAKDWKNKEFLVEAKPSEKNIPCSKRRRHTHLSYTRKTGDAIQFK
jgi:hypothetical protein